MPRYIVRGEVTDTLRPSDKWDQDVVIKADGPAEARNFFLQHHHSGKKFRIAEENKSYRWVDCPGCRQLVETVLDAAGTGTVYVPHMKPNNQYCEEREVKVPNLITSSLVVE